MLLPRKLLGMNINDLILQVKDEFAKGLTHQQIIALFLQKGWTKKEINVAFAEIQKLNTALYRLPDDGDAEIEKNKDAILSLFGWGNWGVFGFGLNPRWKLKTKLIIIILSIIAFLIGLYFELRR